ncbi:hypothetical protein ACFE04_020259 [Oxalis oulophora]
MRGLHAASLVELGLIEWEGFQLGVVGGFGWCREKGLYVGKWCVAYYNHAVSRACKMERVVEDLRVQLAKAVDRLSYYSEATSRNMTRTLDAKREVAILKDQLALVQAEVTRLEEIINEHASVVEKYEAEKAKMRIDMR